MKELSAKLKTMLERKKAKITFFMASVISMLEMSMGIAYGESLENTQLVTGTKELLTSVAAVLTGFALLMTTVLTVKDIIVYMNADEQERPSVKKKIFHTLISGVLCVCAAGLLTAIFAFYGAAS